MVVVLVFNQNKSINMEMCNKICSPFSVHKDRGTALSIYLDIFKKHLNFLNMKININNMYLYGEREMQQ